MLVKYKKYTQLLRIGYKGLATPTYSFYGAIDRELKTGNVPDNDCIKKKPLSQIKGRGNI